MGAITAGRWGKTGRWDWAVMPEESGRKGEGEGAMSVFARYRGVLRRSRLRRTRLDPSAEALIGLLPNGAREMLEGPGVRDVGAAKSDPEPKSLRFAGTSTSWFGLGEAGNRLPRGDAEGRPF